MLDVARCANPACRKELDPERVRKYGARTCNGRCRAAAWKTSVGYGRPARANGPVGRRKESGVQASYRRAVASLSAWLQAQGWDAEDAETEAARVLRPALSDRQRAQLDAREQGDGDA
jgi:hypothetical protein